VILFNIRCGCKTCISLSVCTRSLHAVILNALLLHSHECLACPYSLHPLDLNLVFDRVLLIDALLLHNTATLIDALTKTATLIDALTKTATLIDVLTRPNIPQPHSQNGGWSSMCASHL